MEQGDHELADHDPASVLGYRMGNSVVYHSWYIIGVWRDTFYFRIQQKKLEEEQERATVRQQHEVDEMKLRFFTNVSHEFRTPLTLIMTPLEKLMKTEKDMESQQILKLIYRNADRLLKLVNQLLDFRKIDMQGIAWSCLPAILSRSCVTWLIPSRSFRSKSGFISLSPRSSRLSR